MVVAELVRAGNVNDHMPIVNNVGVLDDSARLPRPVLPLARGDLRTDGMLWRCVEGPES